MNTNKKTLIETAQAKSYINNYIVTDNPNILEQSDNSGNMIIYVTSDGSSPIENDIIASSSYTYKDLYIGDEHIAGGFGFKDISTRNEVIEQVGYMYSYFPDIQSDIETLKEVTQKEINQITIDDKNDLIKINNEEYKLNITDGNKLQIKHSSRLTINSCKLYFKIKDSNYSYIDVTLGDIDNDDNLTSYDLSLLQTTLFTGRDKLSDRDKIAADVNQDGIINSSDVEVLKNDIEQNNIKTVRYYPNDKEYYLEYNSEDVYIPIDSQIEITKIELDCSGSSLLSGIKLAYSVNTTSNYIYLNNSSIDSFNTNIDNTEVLTIYDETYDTFNDKYFTGKYIFPINQSIDEELNECFYQFRFIVQDETNDNVAIYFPKLYFQSPIYFGTSEDNSDISLSNKSSILLGKYDNELNLNFFHGEIETYGIIMIPGSIYYKGFTPNFTFNDSLKIDIDLEMGKTTPSLNNTNYIQYHTPEKYKDTVSWTLSFD